MRPATTAGISSRFARLSSPRRRASSTSTVRELWVPAGNPSHQRGERRRRTGGDLVAGVPSCLLVKAAKAKCDKNERKTLNPQSESLFILVLLRNWRSLLLSCGWHLLNSSRPDSNFTCFENKERHLKHRLFLYKKQQPRYKKQKIIWIILCEKYQLMWLQIFVLPRYCQHNILYGETNCLYIELLWSFVIGLFYSMTHPSVSLIGEMKQNWNAQLCQLDSHGRLSNTTMHHLSNLNFLSENKKSFWGTKRF